MKRSLSRSTRRLESDRDTDIITSSSSDSDGRRGDSYETDLTEPDDTGNPPKRRRSINSPSAPELGGPDGLEEIYNDPLDDTGIDLSEIPEDFDKAKGTIVRRDRIETRWKRSENGGATCRLAFADDNIGTA